MYDEDRPTEVAAHPADPKSLMQRHSDLESEFMKYKARNDESLQFLDERIQVLENKMKMGVGI